MNINENKMLISQKIVFIIVNLYIKLQNVVLLMINWKK